MKQSRKKAAAEGRPGRDFGPLVRQSAANVPVVLVLPNDPETLAYRQAMAARIIMEPGRAVLREDRLDPKSDAGLFVRGGRVRDPLLMMYRGGSVTKPQFDCAESFRDDVALADGCRIDQPDSAGVVMPYSNNNWPAEQRLLAMARVDRTWTALDVTGRGIVLWVVFQNRTLDDYAKAIHVRRETAASRMKASLDVLVLRYRSRVLAP